MPRPISLPFEAEIAKEVTRPGYLIEIAFTAPWRASTRGNFKFNGTPFNAAGVDVRGVSGNGGQLVIDDLDRVVTAYALSEGVSETRIKVWAFYGDPPEQGDIAAWNPWQLFDGYGDDSSLDPNAGRVVLSLVPVSGRTLYTPRLRLTRENGFNWLPPKGRVFEFGGERFVAEPE